MLRDLVENANQYFIRQKKEWTEILVDFETRNQYQVLGEDQQEVGTISEVSSGIGGFMKRNIMGSHRALDIRVHDADGAGVLRLSRPFFFFFSSLEVHAEGGARLGRVERRFGLIRKKYDLLDEHGHCFARIASPLWRLWTFPAKHERENGEAAVSKKWGGALREVFSDADTYRVLIESGTWTGPERWVLFAAAVSIDFDFFENNQGSDGLFSFGD
ncbi:MAG: phospholipid scramblase-related protein [Myxococcota bacterium]